MHKSTYLRRYVPIICGQKMWQKAKINKTREKIYNKVIINYNLNPNLFNLYNTNYSMKFSGRCLKQTTESGNWMNNRNIRKKQMVQSGAVNVFCRPVCSS